MTDAGSGSARKALLGLCLGLAMLAGAQAAPLRLSLDGRAASGPSGESVEQPQAPAAPDEAEAEAELSFIAAPDLPFIDAADVAASVDADWLTAARTQQDDASAAADRRLGEFAPAVPAPLVVSTDPLDGMSFDAQGEDPASASAPDGAAPTEAPDRSALVWMVVPTITLALAVAAWADRGSPRRRKRGA